MYLHLGKQIVVRNSSIIGIFDIDNSSTGKITKEFFKKAQSEGRVVNVTQEIPKSFVVCEDGGEDSVYISQIAPATLKGRAAFKNIEKHSKGDN